MLCLSSVFAQGPYTGEHLNKVAFPIGGLGAGMFCIEGTGAISHVSVKNQMDFFNEPYCCAALCVLGETPEKNIARVVEGAVPEWKFFGRPYSGTGSSGTTYGLPRFRECTFEAKFPFAEIQLKDKSVPVEVSITGWSPFTPPNPDPSGLPLGAIEYTFKNPTDKPLKCIFSFNSKNFINSQGGSIGAINGGFILYDKKGEDRSKHGGFAFYLKDEPAVKVDHCWFRGGWFDPFTITWNNVEQGRIVDNPPVEGNAPGATLAVPFELAAGQTKTVKLLTAWYWIDGNFSSGHRNAAPPTGNYFEDSTKPSSGTARGQQTVSGFLGRGLVNTFDPSGDAPQGVLVSPEFVINKKFIHLLIGGGKSCGVSLSLNGKVVRNANGQDSEQLDWVSFDTAEFAGQKGILKINDNESGSWGHILCDHIVFSDEEIKNLKTGSSGNDGNEILNDPQRVQLFADFENNYGTWKAEKRVEKKKEETKKNTPALPENNGLIITSDEPTPEFYKPYYAVQFDSLAAVAEHWRKNYDTLKQETELFTKTFYDTTLPKEVIDSVAANLTILKTPTILRQHDGRLWCWEGCNDRGGSCAGTCTHVWNYAQAIPHLFPSMERSLRQTEYFESSSDGTGRQAFRSILPIAPGGQGFDAADGQLGGIMKIYREWKVFGNDNWLKLYFPKVKLSLDYMIEKWDPRHTGLLEESHHNTYDINYFGPDGHCGSFYLGALTAFIEMGKYIKQSPEKYPEFKDTDLTLYEELLSKGKKRIVSELFNGEYFIQIVQKDGLTNNFAPLNPKDQSAGYEKNTEIVNEQGPKYQYGTGCLSDGVLGFWIAKCCGIDTDILPKELVEKHLLAVHKYNLKRDLSEHSNPQRPSYAIGNDGGLLLCSWQHNDKPLLPFVYSDEVWTGIEYQVASHLMMLGHVKEGLEIVELIRKRYDGVRRNPFNEYECGHWYARAMSSYGLLQGLTGVRYNAAAKTLFIDSQVGDFRSFLSTETGYGTVIFKNGKAEVKTISGSIPVEKVVYRR
jgi:uncharacterized protein (DUF608 family)